jgi:uncharacterized membrane protein
VYGLYVYITFVWKLEGNRPLERPTRKQNIKTDLKEIGSSGSGQSPLNMVTNLWAPCTGGNLLDQTNKYWLSRILLLRVKRLL